MAARRGTDGVRDFLGRGCGLSVALAIRLVKTKLEEAPVRISASIACLRARVSLSFQGRRAKKKKTLTPSPTELPLVGFEKTPFTVVGSFFSCGNHTTSSSTVHQIIVGSGSRVFEPRCSTLKAVDGMLRCELHGVHPFGFEHPRF